MQSKAIFFLIGCLLMIACTEQKHKPSVMFGQAEVQSAAAYDLADIQASGELIATVLSGPETYYEYRGAGFGIEYEMALSFASNIGTRLRIEIAQDSAELIRKLEAGEADIALTIPSWQVRPNSPELASALHSWWDPELRDRTRAAERQKRNNRLQVRRVSRPPMLSHEKGIISNYDALFQRHAPVAGVDWRLMAAQCYQESAFDPKAVSWAGAQGLMQIMPGTASQLGLSPSAVFEPSQNIAAAARYLSMLQTTFSDIRERRERLCFVLAAYNGGVAHVRDAMALTAKNGGNAQRWSDVQRYILLLSNPRYYRDPVVKAGYLRGNETASYVQQILSRWSQYRGSAHALSPSAPPSSTNGNRNPRIRSREDFLKDSLR